MTSYEKKQILTLNETLAKEIQIGVIESDHEKSLPIRQFCATLSHLVPKIRIKQEQDESSEFPAIRVHDGLRFQAVPSGTEILPFIEALKLLESDKTPVDRSLSACVKNIKLPAHLVAYVSAQCKFCSETVRQFLPLPILNHHIRLTIIDGMHFPELAAKDRVQSVPTLILEGQYRWTGNIQVNEIVDIMASRDPRFLGPASLEMMLKEGRASKLAEMMLEKLEIFPAFYEVLVHPRWPVRLGAMVVMEELIGKNPDLAFQSLEPLWQRFFKVDNRVKGDLLYIFGEMRRKEIIPKLETVLNSEEDAEVKESAREALYKLK